MLTTLLSTALHWQAAGSETTQMGDLHPNAPGGNRDAVGRPHASPLQASQSFRCYNSSSEVIRLAVLRYGRFPLSSVRAFGLIELFLDLSSEIVHALFPLF